MGTPKEMPTIQMQPQAQGSKQALKILLIVIALALIAVGVYFWIKQGGGGQSASNQKFSSENVKVVDNNKQVPNGFPKDLPVEGTITQSNTLNYPDRGLTLYSISLNSPRQSEELYAAYGSYLKTNKYQVTNQSKASTLMTYNATAGKNDLSILIRPMSAGAAVELAFVVRK